MLRSTAISDEELATLVASRRDLEPAGPMLGRIPGGQAVPFSESGLFRWKGPTGNDNVLVVMSSDGIHITEGGAAARSLADSIASTLNGWVQEG